MTQAGSVVGEVVMAIDEAVARLPAGSPLGFDPSNKDYFTDEAETNVVKITAARTRAVYRAALREIISDAVSSAVG
jgi:hypothetical protein